ncbi:hypothetical protein GUQ63_004542, partial [Salmonella enterica subsp. enterica serovar Kentucky]|nr:hypothetical protein [Salmonella enterica subsp. enterica serovar Kentucky]
SDLLCWQIDYAGGSLNVNGTIMRDTYKLAVLGTSYSYIKSISGSDIRVIVSP